MQQGQRTRKQRLTAILLSNKIAQDQSTSYRSPFVGNIIMARALLAAALSNDFVKLRLQLHEQMICQL